MGNPVEYRSALTDFSRLKPITSLVPKVRNASDATYNYTGLAAPGSLTSDPVWLVFRTETATGDIDHADGNHDYDNIWDNYASLSYS